METVSPLVIQPIAGHSSVYGGSNRNIYSSVYTPPYQPMNFVQQPEPAPYDPNELAQALAKTSQLEVEQPQQQQMRVVQPGTGSSKDTSSYCGIQTEPGLVPSPVLTEMKGTESATFRATPNLQTPSQNNPELSHLVHNPMFSDLQATLATDCVLQCVPYTLVQTNKDSSMTPRDSKPQHSSMDLLVEDATLQAEFRQLMPLRNPRVCELENFYNTQSATILRRRQEALEKIQKGNLSEDQAMKEASAINLYHDEEQGHLTMRISNSLQLLKQSLPREQAQPGGGIKKSKSRLLNTKAVAIMSDWYERHIDNPYPTEVEKQDMASQGGISLAQVKAWFANKRNRSLNTKPRREKHKLQQQLSKICQHIQNSQSTSIHAHEDFGLKHDLSHNYNTLMDNFSQMVTENTWTARNNPY